MEKKLVMFFCLKLKISKTTELIEFLFLNLRLWAVLGYLSSFLIPLNTEPLDARGAASNLFLK